MAKTGRKPKAKPSTVATSQRRATRSASQVPEASISASQAQTPAPATVRRTRASRAQDANASPLATGVENDRALKTPAKTRASRKKKTPSPVSASPPASSHSSDTTPKQLPQPSQSASIEPEVVEHETLTQQTFTHTEVHETDNGEIVQVEEHVVQTTEHIDIMQTDDAQTGISEDDAPAEVETEPEPEAEREDSEEATSEPVESEHGLEEEDAADDNAYWAQAYGMDGDDLPDYEDYEAEDQALLTARREEQDLLNARSNEDEFDWQAYIQLASRINTQGQVDPSMLRQALDQGNRVSASDFFTERVVEDEDANDGENANGDENAYDDVATSTEEDEEEVVDAEAYYIEDDESVESADGEVQSIEDGEQVTSTLTPIPNDDNTADTPSGLISPQQGNRNQPISIDTDTENESESEAVDTQISKDEFSVFTEEPEMGSFMSPPQTQSTPQQFPYTLSYETPPQRKPPDSPQQQMRSTASFTGLAPSSAMDQLFSSLEQALEADPGSHIYTSEPIVIADSPSPPVSPKTVVTSEQLGTANVYHASTPHTDLQQPPPTFHTVHYQGVQTSPAIDRMAVPEATQSSAQHSITPTMCDTSTQTMTTDPEAEHLSTVNNKPNTAPTYCDGSTQTPPSPGRDLTAETGAKRFQYARYSTRAQTHGTGPFGGLAIEERRAQLASLNFPEAAIDMIISRERTIGDMNDKILSLETKLAERNDELNYVEAEVESYRLLRASGPIGEPRRPMSTLPPRTTIKRTVSPTAEDAAASPAKRLKPSTENSDTRTLPHTQPSTTPKPALKVRNPPRRHPVQFLGSDSDVSEEEELDVKEVDPETKAKQEAEEKEKAQKRALRNYLSFGRHKKPDPPAAPAEPVTAATTDAAATAEPPAADVPTEPEPEARPSNPDSGSQQPSRKGKEKLIEPPRAMSEAEARNAEKVRLYKIARAQIDEEVKAGTWKPRPFLIDADGSLKKGAVLEGIEDLRSESEGDENEELGDDAQETEVDAHMESGESSNTEQTEQAANAAQTPERPEQPARGSWAIGSLINTIAASTPVGVRRLLPGLRTAAPSTGALIASAPRPVATATLDNTNHVDSAPQNDQDAMQAEPTTPTPRNNDRLRAPQTEPVNRQQQAQKPRMSVRMARKNADRISAQAEANRKREEQRRILSEREAFEAAQATYMIEQEQKAKQAGEKRKNQDTQTSQSALKRMKLDELPEIRPKNGGIGYDDDEPQMDVDQDSYLVDTNTNQIIMEEKPKRQPQQQEQEEHEGPAPPGTWGPYQPEPLPYYYNSKGRRHENPQAGPSKYASWPTQGQPGFRHAWQSTNWLNNPNQYQGGNVFGAKAPVKPRPVSELDRIAQEHPTWTPAQCREFKETGRLTGVDGTFGAPMDSDEDTTEVTQGEEADDATQPAPAARPSTASGQPSSNIFQTAQQVESQDLSTLAVASPMPSRTPAKSPAKRTMTKEQLEERDRNFLKFVEDYHNRPRCGDILRRRENEMRARQEKWEAEEREKREKKEAEERAERERKEAEEKAEKERKEAEEREAREKEAREREAWEQTERERAEREKKEAEERKAQEMKELAAAQAKKAQEAKRTSEAVPTTESTNIFTTTDTTASAETDTSQQWTQPPPPRPTPAHASLPSTQLFPSDAQQGQPDALTRMRSQVEKHKPLKPSGLRAMSRLSTSTVASDDGSDDAQGLGAAPDVGASPFTFPQGEPIIDDPAVLTDINNQFSNSDAIQHSVDDFSTHFAAWETARKAAGSGLTA